MSLGVVIPVAVPHLDVAHEAIVSAMGADEICISTECTGPVRADQNHTFALWDALYEARACRHREHGRTGEGRARNLALSVCEADWVFFLDADDLLLDSALVKMREAMAAGVASVWYAPECETDQGTKWRYMNWLELGESLKHGNLPNVPANLLVRRQAVVEGGGYDEGLTWGAERDMLIRLVKAGNVVGHLEPVVRVRSALSTRKHPGYTMDPGPFMDRIRDGYYQ